MYSAAPLFPLNVYRPYTQFAIGWNPECIVYYYQDPVPCAVAPLSIRLTARVTPLRLYRIRAMSDGDGRRSGAFEVINNRGQPMFCLWRGCAHICARTEFADQNWKLVWVPLADLPDDLR